MTVTLTLPTAWQPGHAAGEPAETVVEFGDLADGLGALAATCGATVGEVLVAAHVKVLGTLTADHGLSTDVSLPEHERPVAVEVHRDAETWRQLLQQVVKDLRSGEESAAAPAGRDATRPDRVLFAAAAGPGTAYALLVAPEDGRLRLTARAESVAPARFAVLAEMYRLVLEAMAAAPDGDALAARLPAGERQLVLHTWASGDTVDHGTDTVDVLIHAQARRTPDAVAVRSDEGTLTFRELDERANRIAHHLRDLGAEPGTLVGVCLRRGPDLLPAFIGVWRSGAGYLPLDPDLPPERLRVMVETAGCETVLTETAQLPLLEPVDGVRSVLVDGDRAAIDARPSGLPDTPADPYRLAYVIYTSGSTGAPKGVMVEHRGLANYLLWAATAYAGRGTGGSAAFSSISFDLGIPNLFSPLLAGQPVHLLPDPLPIADLGEHLVAGGPYSFLKMTPGQLDLLSLDLTPEETRDLAGIAIAAGDAFTADLAGRWIAAAGPDGTAVATEYGPTEITIGNSGYVVTEPPGNVLVPLGDPIPNTTMYVLTDRLEPLPVGVAGEVHIGGVGVARGYLHRPELTEERFLPDPYGPPGARLYKTGDRARWLPDGSLEFLGRVDHQIKIRGYRVEPGEIQEQLRRHPGVAEVVVIAADPDARTQSLAAFVLPGTGAAPEAASLREHLGGRLPEYMIPSSFVTVDRFPLTANGKVDVRQLRSRLEP
ncbi:amino acid adenylation domain-containing protein [Kitasatospora sp. NPDC050467]|uniref:amino acid adenylation domain-containing protein n=1 Tax=Kitasatospora sp. NPDC050467 TaxID=3364053 RepID=UPI0037B3339E